MKRIFTILSLSVILNATLLKAQDMDFIYDYSSPSKEHIVMNIPKDSSYLQWGIWMDASEMDFKFHTMKLFLSSDQALFLKHFHGIAEIILGNDERIPISVFTADDDITGIDHYEKILAFQFNQEESNILLEKDIKKIVFYTSYGKFTAKFADKELMQKALFTLKYNIDIFNKTNDRLLSQRVAAKSPFQ